MSPRHRPALVAVVLLGGAGSVPRPAVPAPAGPAYEQILDQFRKVAGRADRVASVRNVTLRRDVAEFRLESGQLYVLAPVADRPVGIAFVGTGSFSFHPPLAIERNQVQQVLGDSIVQTPITTAVFLFADSTLAELERQVTFAPAQGSAKGVAGPAGEAVDWLSDPRTRRIETTLMTALLNGAGNGFFSGFVKRPGAPSLMVKIDPFALEEVELIRHGTQTGQEIQLVSRFPRESDLRDSVDVASKRPEPLELGGYGIDATIGENLGFSAAVTVRLTARHDPVGWVSLDLLESLVVDSVTDGRGRPAEFFRAKNSDELWIRFDPVARPGEARELVVKYHGGLIERGSLMKRFLPSPADPRAQRDPVAADEWLFIKSTWDWFPRYGSQSTDVELTFHTPASLKFASIGRLVDSSVTARVRTTRWKSEAPTRNVSFNLGAFDESQITDPRIPPVTVQMNGEAHRRLNAIFLRQESPHEQVGGDVANSLSFFTRVFGAPLFSHYYATEIPYSHGEAFPGMIHLSWWTFQTVEERGDSEIFRAHEMAHQWWGIGVQPTSDRDRWLAEGFSDFAGLWYMQIILRDNEKYFKQLDDRRKALLAARKDAPPIGIGTRAGQANAEHYSLIIYQKGGWVLHMLRNLMLNFRTMNEDAFSETMRDFYQTYRGRRASTKDFQAVVEKHTDFGMGWFFRQWVDGAAIPTYTLSWRAEPKTDGKTLLRFRVRQEGVPEDFYMPVPLQIEMADGSRIVVRVNVKGTATDAELELPQPPQRLELNPLQSVLAEVKEERWKEPGAIR